MRDRGTTTLLQFLAVFWARVIPMWASIMAAVLISHGRESFSALLLSMVIGFILSCWAGSTLTGWFSMGRLAVQLSDEAAADLNDTDEDSSEVQIAQTMTRALPPRQLYACAIARKGKPVVMYRGWKLFTVRPLDKPADTRTAGFSCRAYKG